MIASFCHLDGRLIDTATQGQDTFIFQRTRETTKALTDIRAALDSLGPEVLPMFFARGSICLVPVCPLTIHPGTHQCYWVGFSSAVIRCRDDPPDPGLCWLVLAGTSPSSKTLLAEPF